MMSIHDIVGIAGFAFLCTVTVIGTLSFKLRYFVALRSRPETRAIWVVGWAYSATVALSLFTYDLGAIFAAAATGLAAAFVWFWWWRMIFRRGWIEKPEDLPNGMTLEEDVWWKGLLNLLRLYTRAWHNTH